MQATAENILVTYYKDLQADPEISYPEEISELHQTGISFEVSKLFEYITRMTKCTRPFIMDIPEREIIPLFASEDDNIRVSAILSVIDSRIPLLQLRVRV